MPPKRARTVAYTHLCPHCDRELEFDTFARGGAGRVNHLGAWNHDDATWTKREGGAPVPGTPGQTPLDILASFHAAAPHTVKPWAPSKREAQLLIPATRQWIMSVGDAVDRELDDADSDSDDDINLDNDEEDDQGVGEDGAADAAPVHDQPRAWGPAPHLALALALRLWASLFRIPQAAVELLLVILHTFARIQVLDPTTHPAGGDPGERLTLKQLDVELRLPATIPRFESFEVMLACRTCGNVKRKRDCYTLTRQGYSRRKIYTMLPCGNTWWANNKEIKCAHHMTTQAAIRGPPTTHRDNAMSFPILSIEAQLREILGRTHVHIAAWTTRTSGAELGGFMADVVDAGIWKRFQTDSCGPTPDRPFLSAGGIGLVFNTDGFQPFKKLVYSVDALYLAVMNLPRHLRYRRENMILCGLVPHGGATNMQMFLRPMVDELLALWEPAVGRPRAAVLCVACDVPAARKAGGFMGHTGRREGPRRRTRYPPKRDGKGTYFGSVPYPGMSQANKGLLRAFRQPFPVRKRKHWTAAGAKWKDARTIGGRKKVRQKTGCAYSELMRLPYTDPSMFVVDAMHNIWEGVWRDLLSQMVNRPAPGVSDWDNVVGWDEKNGMWDDHSEPAGDDSMDNQSDDDLMDNEDAAYDSGGGDCDSERTESDAENPDVIVDQNVEAVASLLAGWERDLKRWKLPRDKGPLMGKIGANMSNLKGQELKTLLNVVFLYMTEGKRIGPDSERCARHIHEAEWELTSILRDISVICSKSIVHTTDIDTLRLLTVSYCNKYEAIYGGDAVKPNHRLMIELPDCVRDYGPCPAFWLFPLERWNGLLTRGNAQPADVEVSIMREHDTYARIRSYLHPGSRLDTSLTQRQRQVLHRDLTKKAVTTGDQLADDPDSDQSDVAGTPDEYDPHTADHWLTDASNVATRLSMFSDFATAGETTATLMIEYVGRFSVDGAPTSATWNTVRGHEWFPGRLRGNPRETNVLQGTIEHTLLLRSLLTLGYEERTLEALRGQPHITLREYQAMDLCGTTLRTENVRDARKSLARGYGVATVCFKRTYGHGDKQVTQTDSEPVAIQRFCTMEVIQDWGSGFPSSRVVYLARVRWFSELHPKASHREYNLKSFQSGISFKESARELGDKLDVTNPQIAANPKAGGWRTYISTQLAPSYCTAAGKVAQLVDELGALPPPGQPVHGRARRRQRVPHTAKAEELAKARKNLSGIEAQLTAFVAAPHAEAWMNHWRAHWRQHGYDDDAGPGAARSVGFDYIPVQRIDNGCVVLTVRPGTADDPPTVGRFAIGVLPLPYAF